MFIANGDVANPHCGALNHDLFHATIAARPAQPEHAEQRATSLKMSNPIAYVLLEQFTPFDDRKLVDSLRERHPDLRWELWANPSQAKANEPVMIRCGDHLMVVMSMPAPIPNDDNLWKRASRTWLEALSVAGRHRAHYVVSTMGAAENRADIARLTDLESARLVTAVVGGLIASTPGCCAVVWGNKVARSPQMWLDRSRKAFAPFPDYPFTLWVEIIPFPSVRTTGAVTVGLDSFAGRDIEFDLEGMDHATVIDRVAGLAIYLIEHGGVVKDGDTIGVSEADRIQVHYRTSRFNGAPVFAVGSDRNVASQVKNYPIIPASIARDHPLLIMLKRAGLFDASDRENQVQLRPDAHVSEGRLESYDKGIIGVFSNILATDAYAEADDKARRALASGDAEQARSVLMPFAKEVREFQEIARVALTNGDFYMFLPK
jgi:hypothetical protein